MKKFHLRHVAPIAPYKLGRRPVIACDLKGQNCYGYWLVSLVHESSKVVNSTHIPVFFVCLSCQLSLESYNGLRNPVKGLKLVNKNFRKKKLNKKKSLKLSDFFLLFVILCLLLPF